MTTTTLLAFAALAVVIMLGLLLAKVLARVLWGRGPTPTARDLRRAAREERWTHGAGSGG